VVRMQRDAKIYVAGHRGLVGSAVVRRLTELGFANIVGRTRDELDLREQEPVRRFFATEEPAYVFLAAARVGGILANATYPAEFIHDNLAIQTNVVQAAYENGAKKLLFLGSSCVYPRECPQPIKEDYLLSGKLEATNEAYAVAKIAGIKMCQAYNRQFDTCFISLMPTNVYGPGDSFDRETSHALPALIRKFHEAKATDQAQVTVWGTGTPRREFLHVDDLAGACVFLMEHYEGTDIINVGVGRDISIRELAGMIAEIVGYRGEIVFDPGKPDGTPRKLLDVSRITALGWQASIPLRRGIAETYEWYRASREVDT
jgi:GDP-L-fucose synthase